MISLWCEKVMPIDSPVFAIVQRIFHKIADIFFHGYETKTSLFALSKHVRHVHVFKNSSRNVSLSVFSKVLYMSFFSTWNYLHNLHIYHFIYKYISANSYAKWKARRCTVHFAKNIYLESNSYYCEKLAFLPLLHSLGISWQTVSSSITQKCIFNNISNSSNMRCRIVYCINICYSYNGVQCMLSRRFL